MEKDELPPAIISTGQEVIPMELVTSANDPLIASHRWHVDEFTAAAVLGSRDKI